MPVVSAIAHVSEIVEGTVIVSILVIESAAGWQIVRRDMTQMPLAANRRGVTGLGKRAGQRSLVQRQPVLCPRSYYATLQAEPHRIPAGQ